jgi:hypothetical protein
MRWDPAYLSLVSLVGIAPTAQVRSEQLFLGSLLGDDVVYGRLLWCRGDSVDGAERQTQQSTSIALHATSVSSFSL